VSTDDDDPRLAFFDVVEPDHDDEIALAASLESELREVAAQACDELPRSKRYRALKARGEALRLKLARLRKRAA
jgi:hypothetical protein